MENLKADYVPPKVEITRVALENTIALQSPVKTVNREDWEPDEQVVPDTGDILLPV